MNTAHTMAREKLYPQSGGMNPSPSASMNTPRNHAPKPRPSSGGAPTPQKPSRNDNNDNASGAKNALLAALSAHKIELIVSAIVLAAVLLLLALISYSPQDYPNAKILLTTTATTTVEPSAPASRQIPRTPVNTAAAKPYVVENWLGYIGASVAHFFYNYTVGCAALLFPVLMVLWAVAIYKQSFSEKLMLGTALALLCATLVASILGVAQLMTLTQSWTLIQHSEWSGSVGQFIARILWQILGTVGALVVLGGAATVTIFAAIDLNIERTIGRAQRESTRLRGVWAAYKNSRQQGANNKEQATKNRQQGMAGAVNDSSMGMDDVKMPFETSSQPFTPKTPQAASEQSFTADAMNDVNADIEPARIFNRTGESSLAATRRDLLSKYGDAFSEPQSQAPKDTTEVFSGRRRVEHAVGQRVEHSTPQNTSAMEAMWENNAVEAPAEAADMAVTAAIAHQTLQNLPHTVATAAVQTAAKAAGNLASNIPTVNVSAAHTSVLSAPFVYPTSASVTYVAAPSYAKEYSQEQFSDDTIDKKNDLRKRSVERDTQLGSLSMLSATAPAEETTPEVSASLVEQRTSASVSSASSREFPREHSHEVMPEPQTIRAVEAVSETESTDKTDERLQSLNAFLSSLELPSEKPQGAAMPSFLDIELAPEFDTNLDNDNITEPLSTIIHEARIEAPLMAEPLVEAPIVPTIHIAKKQPDVFKEAGKQAAHDLNTALDEHLSYLPPTLDLLVPQEDADEVNEFELRENARLLTEKLRTFKIEIENLTVTPGPVVTQYEFVPAAGIKVSQIEGLADDIALALKARGIRIIAPVPGRGTVAVEIANHKPSMVRFSSIVDSDEFRDNSQQLPLALGKTISGDVYCVDLAKMPHLLIAGSTGSGKSVGINSILCSLLYKMHPRQLKVAIIDPKKIEMTQYRPLVKHFLAVCPDIDETIVTNPQNAVILLKSIEAEMERRYDVLAKVGQRNIADYNQKVLEGKYKDTSDFVHREMPYIVLIVDELADLMMTAGRDVEDPIIRLAQLARAVGIHLVVATQRPSVDVVTGLIKANFPARIAYQVASKVDSRTILDMSGAEHLLGNGDMLFMRGGSGKPIRIQNSFLSTEEVEEVCEHICSQQGYSQPYMLPSVSGKAGKGGSTADVDDRDELFDEAARLVVRHQQGSVSLLQRRLKVGYSRAARIVDQLEEVGIVGPFDGSKGRSVLFESEAELEAML